MKYQLPILFPDMRHTFADFFCGCGGLSLGFIKAGGKCISAMDFDPEAIATYWTNLCYGGWSHLLVSPDNTKGIKKLGKMLNDGKTPNWLFPDGVPDNWLSVEAPMPCLNLFLYSILDIDPEQWMDLCGVRPGDIRIFIGGPPCQGFSAMNSRTRGKDERNELPLRYIHYINVCRPEIVVMENVPGILSAQKKKGEKEGMYMRRFREAFDAAGYRFEYRILNALDYGVPQNRRRVIIIASRKDIPDRDRYPAPTHGTDRQPFLSVLEAIGHFPPLHAGETWGKDVLHVYGYNAREGFVICPACLHYNRQERTQCHSCGGELSSPIRGGVVRLPGFGTFFDTQVPVDNGFLRENGNLLRKFTVHD
jgi:site-specific DNA-cytosine methylase